MDLPYSNEDIDSIVDEFAEKLKEFNSRELKSDWFAIFLDAKVLEVKNKNNIVKQGCLYTFVGVSLEGKKEILLSRFFYDNESIEKWKICFNDIKNRGLSRVLLFISDDFNEINKIITSFFPYSEHQLCIVHLLRNTKYKLNKNDFLLFKLTIEKISLFFL